MGVVAGSVVAWGWGGCYPRSALPRCGHTPVSRAPRCRGLAVSNTDPPRAAPAAR